MKDMVKLHGLGRALFVTRIFSGQQTPVQVDTCSATSDREAPIRDIWRGHRKLHPTLPTLLTPTTA